jgi:hypothetical protein
LVVLGFSACAKIPRFSDITLILDPASEINEGVLLPVDILAVDSVISSKALEIGPDNWFGEDVRDRLTDGEIQRLAIKGGEEKKVSVKVNKSVHRIIIFADFENNSEAAGQQAIIIPEKFRFRPTYTILINDNSLELVR